MTANNPKLTSKERERISAEKRAEREAKDLYAEQMKRPVFCRIPVTRKNLERVMRQRNMFGRMLDTRTTEDVIEPGDVHPYIEKLEQIMEDLETLRDDIADDIDARQGRDLRDLFVIGQSNAYRNEGYDYIMRDLSVSFPIKSGCALEFRDGHLPEKLEPGMANNTDEPSDEPWCDARVFSLMPTPRRRQP